jgi:hypothetical protein
MELGDLRLPSVNDALGAFFNDNGTDIMGGNDSILGDCVIDTSEMSRVVFSGHGLAAGLVLEKPDGSSDLVKSEELLDLLRRAGLA